MNSNFISDLYSKKNRILFENEFFFAYFDDKPITAGHCIIVPKEEVASFFELSHEQSDLLYSTIVQVRNRLADKFKPDGYNLVVNEGEAAGKVVSILVIHIIPRYKNDTVHPLMSGARNILGMYSKPEMPKLEKERLNADFTSEQLRKLFYEKTGPDKQFFLGLKVLLLNEKGEILVLHKDDFKFKGIIDLPGGRCEHRDTDEFKTAQRELFEETGIHAKKLEFFDSFVLWDVSFDKETTHPIGLVLSLYYGIQFSSEIPELKKDENFSGYSWLSPQKVADLLVQYPERVKEKIRDLSLKHAL